MALRGYGPGEFFREKSWKDWKIQAKTCDESVGDGFEEQNMMTIKTLANGLVNRLRKDVYHTKLD